MTVSLPSPDSPFSTLAELIRSHARQQPDHVALRDDQHGRPLDNGGFELRVPYSQEPELLMDILKYGADCEVVGPKALREKVVGLLKAAVGRYEDE